MVFGFWSVFCFGVFIGIAVLGCWANELLAVAGDYMFRRYERRVDLMDGISAVHTFRYRVSFSWARLADLAIGLTVGVVAAVAAICVVTVAGLPAISAVSLVGIAIALRSESFSGVCITVIQITKERGKVMFKDLIKAILRQNQLIVSALQNMEKDQAQPVVPPATTSVDPDATITGIAPITCDRMADDILNQGYAEAAQLLAEPTADDTIQVVDESIIEAIVPDPVHVSVQTGPDNEIVAVIGPTWTIKIPARNTLYSCEKVGCFAQWTSAAGNPVRAMCCGMSFDGTLHFKEFNLKGRPIRNVLPKLRSGLHWESESIIAEPVTEQPQVQKEVVKDKANVQARSRLQAQGEALPPDPEQTSVEKPNGKFYVGFLTQEGELVRDSSGNIKALWATGNAAKQALQGVHRLNRRKGYKTVKLASDKVTVLS
jgi:hypothetical protein